ncbi:hypothetical protein GGS23DRAFT_422598 [Durotheca rogersii]|uniref:uncharacterized protein n=1 Tax=Durotheca rogersii TaxID=419775 RepID=UPI00221E78D3|nr:uncharacterized protein GGS23DRAFT_422598 [Durotheca rogersii]KAI5865343.1 hypothetical protein GGS23DRAFT_422598 [Durotheca rogersii]
MRFSTAGLVALVAAAMGTPLPYKPNTVDSANTRSLWVTSYSNKADDYVTVDASNTYPEKAGSGSGPPKKGGKHVLERRNPHGPDYLKLDYSPIYHEHLITLTSGKVMYRDSLGGVLGAVTRLLNI